MNLEKKNYILILYGIILTIIIFIIVGVLIFNRSSEAPIVPTPTPSPFPLTPTKTIYDKSGQDKLLETVQNRKSLAPGDAEAKKNILSLLPPEKKSGIVYQSPDINIEYVSSPNIFQVEILTQDVKKAKIEAVNWFKSRGMSDQGICNYPVQFYLNYNILQKLRGTDFVFSPLADSCQ